MSSPAVLIVAIIIAAVAAFIYKYYYRGSSKDTPPSQKRMSVSELAEYTGHVPSAWGPQTWHLMHIVSINFSLTPTDADREAFSMFIAGLALVLPCGVCRGHFQEALAGEMAIPPADLVDRRSVFAWTVRMHARVNRQLGKNQTDDVDHWFRHYTNLRQS